MKSRFPVSQFQVTKIYLVVLIDLLQKRHLLENSLVLYCAKAIFRSIWVYITRFSIASDWSLESFPGFVVADSSMFWFYLLTIFLSEGRCSFLCVHLINISESIQILAGCFRLWKWDLSSSLRWVFQFLLPIRTVRKNTFSIFVYSE